MSPELVALLQHSRPPTPTLRYSHRRIRSLVHVMSATTSPGLDFAPLPQGPVTSLAVDATGRHLVTAGAEGQVKVWDVRTLKPLHAYFSARPAQCVEVSQRGLLAVGHGRRVQVRDGRIIERKPSCRRSPNLPSSLCRMQGGSCCACGAKFHKPTTTQGPSVPGLPKPLSIEEGAMSARVSLRRCGRTRWRPRRRRPT